MLKHGLSYKTKKKCNDYFDKLYFLHHYNNLVSCIKVINNSLMNNNGETFTDTLLT